MNPTRCFALPHVMRVGESARRRQKPFPTYPRLARIMRPRAPVLPRPGVVCSGHRRRRDAAELAMGGAATYTRGIVLDVGYLCLPERRKADRRQCCAGTRSGRI